MLWQHVSLPFKPNLRTRPPATLPRSNCFHSLAASLNSPLMPDPCPLPNFRVPSCDSPSTPSPKPKVPPLPLFQLPPLLPRLATNPEPATTPAASTTATALPTTQPTQHTTTQPQPVNAPAPENVTPVVDQTPDGKNGQDVNTSAAPPAEKNRNTAKAEAKLEKALEYLATLNTTATAKPDKWVVNASILASLTGCYRPAINTFIEARKQRIDELNAAHGLGPGHNRATARTQPNAIPELVKRFKEEVLGQPF